MISIVTTVTTKGQVTIPKHIRTYLGVKAFSKVEFKKEGNKITIQPVVDFLSLAGSFSSKKKVPLEDWDKLLEENFKKEYGKKYKNH